jgi:hypothetical protein
MSFSTDDSIINGLADNLHILSKYSKRDIIEYHNLKTDYDDCEFDPVILALMNINLELVRKKIYNKIINSNNSDEIEIIIEIKKMGNCYGYVSGYRKLYTIENIIITCLETIDEQIGTNYVAIYANYNDSFKTNYFDIFFNIVKYDLID